MPIAQRSGFLALIFCFGLLLTGCEKPVEESNWGGGLIRKVGTYKLSSSQQTITVYVDKEHIVRYSILDRDGKTLIASTERPSAYQGWYAFFDKQGWLWFHSSDIGESVAQKEEDGSYKELPIVDDAALIRAMPEEFFNRLPESIRKKWSIHRKQGGSSKSTIVTGLPGVTGAEPFQLNSCDDGGTPGLPLSSTGVVRTRNSPSSTSCPSRS
jgi:hypothetical protein